MHVKNVQVFSLFAITITFRYESWRMTPFYMYTYIYVSMNLYSTITEVNTMYEKKKIPRENHLFISSLNY